MKHLASRLMPWYSVPPEQMTLRARLYLLATAGYCFGIGITCVLDEQVLTTASFAQIEKMMPCGFYGWGLVHFYVGFAALYAAWRGIERWAWIALMGATGVVGPWAAGLFIAWHTLPKVAPTGVIAYSFITVIHLIQARQPLRSPFDPVLRSIEPKTDD